MKLLVGVLIAAAWLMQDGVLSAQRAAAAVTRPKILGLAHAAFYVSDLA
jgi:hypothetical protein